MGKQETYEIYVLLNFKTIPIDMLLQKIHLFSKSVSVSDLHLKDSKITLVSFLKL